MKDGSGSKTTEPPCAGVDAFALAVTVVLKTPSAGSFSSRLPGTSGADGSPALSLASTVTVTVVSNGVVRWSSAAVGVIAVIEIVMVDRAVWSNQSDTRYFSVVAEPVKRRQRIEPDRAVGVHLVAALPGDRDQLLQRAVGRVDQHEAERIEPGALTGLVVRERVEL